MLNPAYLASCGDDVAALFAQLEADITADVASRVVRMGRFSDTSDWQQQKLREASAAYDMSNRMLQKCQKKARAGVKNEFVLGSKEALAFDDAIYKAAGMNPESIASSRALMDVVIAGVQKTNGVMDNLTMTTARDASHSVQNALDRAYMQVTSGAYSYDEAARRCINTLGEKGYRAFLYDSGTKTSLEAAVRRALLTGLNQTTAQLQIARAQDMGCDLVEVTSHAGARPEHFVWQGKIYCLTGARGRYKDFYKETGYGTGPGLCGWNCYHNFYPFLEGYSTPSFEHDPTRQLGMSNNKLYELTQTQRSLERYVRQSRRECQTLDAAIQEADDELAEKLNRDFTAASVKLKRREARLSQYCRDNGLRYDGTRVSTYGYGRSTSAKAVWANRKAVSLTNNIKSATIRTNSGMLRNAGNRGVFSHLPERMSKKHIREVANEYGISLKGIKLFIDSDPEKLREEFMFAGRADDQSVGRIDFFPKAFGSKEELVRTLFHEQLHVQQFRKHGSEYVQNNRGYFEEVTSKAEDEFISVLKEEGTL